MAAAVAIVMVSPAVSPTKHEASRGSPVTGLVLSALVFVAAIIVIIVWTRRLKRDMES